MVFNPRATGQACGGLALSRSFTGAAWCLAVGAALSLGFAGAGHRGASWCLAVGSSLGFTGAGHRWCALVSGWHVRKGCVQGWVMVSGFC